MMNLCTSNPAYDCEDIARRETAITIGKIKLGAALHRDNLLLLHGARWGEPNPYVAGSYAADVLHLSDDELLTANPDRLTEWVGVYRALQSLRLVA